MKTMYFFLTPILLFVNIHCRKEKAQLPPITTTGAMTFGCKVNGEVFVPKGRNGRPGLSPEYAYDHEGSDSGWHFASGTSNWTAYKTGDIMAVGIFTNALMLEENKQYQLGSRELGNAFGDVHAVYEDIYYTTNGSGTLFISRHDKQQRIISGTFSFEATGQSTGKKISVTDGRFDLRY